MKVIADALVEVGVARNIIRLAPQPAADDGEFAASAVALSFRSSAARA